jgi:hypothetical protein
MPWPPILRAVQNGQAPGRSSILQILYPSFACLLTFFVTLVFSLAVSYNVKFRDSARPRPMQCDLAQSQAFAILCAPLPVGWSIVVCLNGSSGPPDELTSPRPGQVRPPSFPNAVPNMSLYSFILSAPQTWPRERLISAAGAPKIIGRVDRKSNEVISLGADVNTAG